MSYGYLHLARVLTHNVVSNTYNLQSVALARTSRWPSVPSCVPGLQANDQVVVAATGTSRDNLLIVGRVGNEFPDIGEIPGLSGILTGLDNRLDTAESTLVSLDERVGDTESGLTGLDGRLDTAESLLITHTSEIAAGVSALASHAATLGLHGGLLPVASKAARDALTGNYAGRPIYREDKDWVEVHDGTVWRSYTQVCTDPLDITHPNDGQTVYHTTSNVIYRYELATGAWIPLWIKSNHIKRFGTTSSTATTFQNVPFATVAESGFGGISTPDDIVFTFTLPGMWKVNAMLSSASGAPIVASLHEGANTDPFAGGNTEIYALDSSGNAGGIGAVNLATEVRVPTASARSIRCSAFSASTTMRSGLGRPRITFNWSPL